MNPYRPPQYPYETDAELAYSPSKVALLKKVYGLLTASVVFSALGAMIALYAGTSTSQMAIHGVAVPPLVYLFLANWWLPLVLLFGSVFGASAVRMKPGVNVVALFGMATILGGAVIAPAIFVAQLNTMAGYALVGSPVRDAFVLAVSGFAGLSCYAIVTKKDFSGWGGMLTMGLFVVIGASFLSFFFGGWSFYMAVESAAVLLFGALVLYRTSMLLRMGERDPVGITIGLYMSLINLFMSLLSILSGGRRR